MNTQPPNLKHRKKRGGGIFAIILVIVLVVCGAAFFGYLSMNNNTSSTTSKPQIESNSNTSNTNKIEVKDVTDIVKVAKPTVVEILTESVSNSFFGQNTQQGAGSGVIISNDGYIVTNNHVVDGANSIQVTTADGQTYQAQLIGTDSTSDLAVIKIDATDLPAATIGDSSTLEVGEPAIAIGNPLGSLGGSVSSGIISALDREISIEGETMTLLQTDAAINPGNSGGGLFDQNGELIGIVNAKQSATGIEGLGFAIPISGAVDIINDLISNGNVTSRPALNVSIQDVTNQNSYFNQDNSNGEEGVYIVQIVPGGAADAAGLQVNDRIISFDGQNISSSSELKNIIKKHKIGDSVHIVVERNGQQVEADVTLQSSTMNN